MEFILNLIFIIAGLGMVASVLLQSSKSAGLSGSITGGSQSLFS